VLNDYTATVTELEGAAGDDDAVKAHKLWLASAVRRHLGAEGVPENGLKKVHRISWPFCYHRLFCGRLAP